MKLAYGQGIYHINHLASGAGVVAGVDDVLSDAGYTYDRTCLAKFSLSVFQSAAESPYSVFVHALDTLEYNLHYVEPYCLHAKFETISDCVCDPYYRSFVRTVRDALFSSGAELLDSPFDWWKLIYTDTATPIQFECLSNTMLSYGAERSKPDDCLYKTLDLYDDGGYLLAHQSFVDRITSYGGEVISGTCLLNTYKTYVA